MNEENNLINIDVNADFIRDLRKRLNMNLAEFGNIFGVYYTTVASWEQGKSSPNQYYKDTMRLLYAKLLKEEKFFEIKKKVLGLVAFGSFIALLAWLSRDD